MSLKSFFIFMVELKVLENFAPLSIAMSVPIIIASLNCKMFKTREGKLHFLHRKLFAASRG